MRRRSRDRRTRAWFPRAHRARRARRAVRRRDVHLRDPRPCARRRPRHRSTRARCGRFDQIARRRHRARGPGCSCDRGRGCARWLRPARRRRRPCLDRRPSPRRARSGRGRWRRRACCRRCRRRRVRCARPRWPPPTPCRPRRRGRARRGLRTRASVSWSTWPRSSWSPPWGGHLTAPAPPGARRAFANRCLPAARRSAHRQSGRDVKRRPRARAPTGRGRGEALPGRASAVDGEKLSPPARCD